MLSCARHHSNRRMRRARCLHRTHTPDTTVSLTTCDFISSALLLSSPIVVEQRADEVREPGVIVLSGWRQVENLWHEGSKASQPDESHKNGVENVVVDRYGEFATCDAASCMSGGVRFHILRQVKPSSTIRAKGFLPGSHTCVTRHGGAGHV
jgi:hypothetical protein